MDRCQKKNSLVVVFLKTFCLTLLCLGNSDLLRSCLFIVVSDLTLLDIFIVHVCVCFLCFLKIFVLIFSYSCLFGFCLFVCFCSKESEKDAVESSWWGGGKNLKEV